MRPGAIWCRAVLLCALFVLPKKPEPDRRGDTISEGANTLTIAKRDQKTPDGPSDNLLVLMCSVTVARLGANRFYRPFGHHRRRRWMASRPALQAWTTRGRAAPVGTIC